MFHWWIQLSQSYRKFYWRTGSHIDFSDCDSWFFMTVQKSVEPKVKFTSVFKGVLNSLKSKMTVVLFSEYVHIFRVTLYQESRSLHWLTPPLALWLLAPSGQAGECAGSVPPADGAVPGAAGPHPKDRLPAKAAAGRSGHHQGPNLTPLHGMYAIYSDTSGSIHVCCRPCNLTVYVT